MRNLAAAGLAALLLGVGLSGAGRRDVGPARQAAPMPLASHAPAPPPVEDQNALVAKYCAPCHSDRLRTGGLSLEGFDAADAVQNAAIAEKMIRKLRAGMMPPADVRRPDAATLDAFATALETRIDEAAAASPHPGTRPFQRLNRAEYARAVHDLLAVEADVTAFLPPDTISDGFDNIADVQTFSPTLMEGYLRAASHLSRLAVGDRNASATSVTYRIGRTASQLRRVDGAPMGTRGGISVLHTFPADGEYVFRMSLHYEPLGGLFGRTTMVIRDLVEQVEVSINGERVALVELNPRMSETDEDNSLLLETPPLHVQAGPQRVTAAFIDLLDGPADDLLEPIENTLADVSISFGVTTQPHLRDLAIVGPRQVTGVSDTPSRRKIFACRPLSAAEEEACAGEIVTRLATDAYRGAVSDEDVAELMAFYEQGREQGGFEGGIRMAVQAILTSPQFLFRLEEEPAAVAPGGTYPLASRELASRLSFFLWGTVPDEALLEAASRDTLRSPEELERQARRLLADPRSAALATRFAAQWLRLQDLDKIQPDYLLYPHYDDTLADAMKRETELFFDSIVREDRNVLDLLTADYTFVNERLARHYALPGVAGSSFRRVTLPESRRGLLGHGSILTLTSVADRTSPVQRGKWVMEVLMGSPPPPPPPNVPDLEATEAAADGKLLSVRERMEAHRRNPACSSCHRVIDPLGLALENFDATGAWRIKDNEVPVDVVGELYDGSTIDGPAGLRAALLKRSDVVLSNFTENLMTYALGRRVEHTDMPAVRAIVRNAASNGNRLSSFVVGVVGSAAFRMGVVDTSPTPTEPDLAGGSVAR